MQAGKEWRVVTQFLEKLCTADRNEMPVGPLADCESLTEIDYSMFNVKKTGFIPIGLWEEYFPLSAFEFFVMLIPWFMLFSYQI